MFLNQLLDPRHERSIFRGAWVVGWRGLMLKPAPNVGQQARAYGAKSPSTAWERYAARRY